jgi:hypothetical protein
MMMIIMPQLLETQVKAAEVLGVLNAIFGSSTDDGWSGRVPMHSARSRAEAQVCLDSTRAVADLQGAKGCTCFEDSVSNTDADPSHIPH